MKSLNSFGKTDGTFLLAFGGNGCPFDEKMHAPSWCAFSILESLLPAVLTISSHLELTANQNLL